MAERRRRRLLPQVGVAGTCFQGFGIGATPVGKCFQGFRIGATPVGKCFQGFRIGATPAGKCFETCKSAQPRRSIGLSYPSSSTVGGRLAWTVVPLEAMSPRVLLDTPRRLLRHPPVGTELFNDLPSDHLQQPGADGLSALHAKLVEGEVLSPTPPDSSGRRWQAVPALLSNVLLTSRHLLLSSSKYLDHRGFLRAGGRERPRHRTRVDSPSSWTSRLSTSRTCTSRYRFCRRFASRQTVIWSLP